jgi:transcriptional regulator with XRE-family HTH domain
MDKKTYIASSSKIGKNIKFHRQLQEVSQTVLARAVGVAPAYISQIEAGLRRPSLKVLDRICAALDVRVSALLDEELPLTRERTIKMLRSLILYLANPRTGFEGIDDAQRPSSHANSEDHSVAPRLEHDEQEGRAANSGPALA